jgi:hypothetical protein
MTIRALAPVARQRVFLPTGIVASGAKLWTYSGGTNSLLATYNDADLTVPNTNPVLADAAGLLPAIYLLPQVYRFVLTTALGEPLWPQDDVCDVGSILAGSGTFSAVTVTGAAVVGTLTLTGVPTTDPEVAGQVWSDSGVLTISAG